MHPVPNHSKQAAHPDATPVARGWGSPGARPGWLALGLLLLLGCWGLATAAWGVERFPPPEFEPGSYTMPPTTTPLARAYWLNFLDMALLFGALAAAAYLVLVKRSRKWVFGLMVFSLLYFGFYRQGCVCAIGAIQNVTFALFNRGYAAPMAVVVFFLLPLGFTLFFGRVFCAAVCPLGAMQDIVLWRPVKAPGWLAEALGLIPFLYLGAAVLFAATGSAFVICEYDPFVAFFRRTGSLKMLLLGAGFLVVGMFLGRPYCRFFCPYGALLSLLSRFSKWNVTLTPEDCIRCQVCDVACPYGAIAEPNEAPAAPAPRPDWARLTVLAVLLPVLITAGAWLGGQLSVPFSRMHPTVRLAERVAAEETAKPSAPVAEPPDNNALAPAVDPAEENLRLASKAVRQTGRPLNELFDEALRLRGQFRLGGYLLGAFAGLLLGLKLLALGLPKSRSIYEPDRANCVACCRCHTYCPKELVRVKKAERAKAAPPLAAPPAPAPQAS